LKSPFFYNYEFHHPPAAGRRIERIYTEEDFTAEYTEYAKKNKGRRV